MKRIYSSEKTNFGASPLEIKTYIELLRQDDETVWLVIYGQNQQRFLNYVRTLDKSNQISDIAVENLVEKAYGKFLNRLRGAPLQNQNDLKKYFFSILYHEVINFFRKPPMTDYGDEWLARIKNEDDSDANLKAEKEVVFKLMDNALPLLKEKQKKVIDLKYYHEPPMDLQEIAEKLGETYDNIRAIHKRAKDKLRAIISNGLLQTK